MESITESTDVQKMDLVCRTCLNESINLKSIFTDDTDDIYKMLLSCSGLKIHSLDGFPTKICSVCLTKLQFAYEFRKQCEMSHNELVNLMERKINGNVDIEIKTELRSDTEDSETKLLNRFEIYTCSLCPNQYKMLAHLQEHFWADHPEVSHKFNGLNAIDLKMECVEEKYNISQPDLFIAKSKEDHYDKNVKTLGFCKTTSSQNVGKSVDLLNHLKDNRDEQSWIRSHRNRRHKNSGTPKTEICEICQKAFTTPKNLQIHKTTTHRCDTEWMSTCLLSSLTFETKSSYKQHIKSQPKKFVELHQCQCGKNFTRLSNLHRHQITHWDMNSKEENSNLQRLHVI